ncbi:MAG: KpsF/GutQ family sugar-phosphate isomerase, partial [Holosporales bacterium]|nr:KpsF/GutQ family sugar-phosphate isomerase [Holosporales bacterium]
MVDCIKEAIRVILEEAEGLKALAYSLPDNFLDAIELIFNATGSLVISGVGKSGHIGRKIASTMASMGQRSFFLHPSEACHGDLGMIDADDILLLISYSGESSELFPVVDFAKRFGNKIISISKNADSPLANNSDIALILPDLKEACLLGVAPTVSSTVTLALGDALAVSLLSKRGLTKEQFKAFHPGGAIGKTLSSVFDIMRQDIPIVTSGESMQKGILTMSQFSLGCVGVVDGNGKLVGMITDGDLRRNMSD